MQQQQQSKLVQTFNAYRTRDTRSGIVRRESERQVESKHRKQKINSRKCLLLTDKIITNKKKNKNTKRNVTAKAFLLLLLLFFCCFSKVFSFYIGHSGWWCGVCDMCSRRTHAA